MAKCKINKSRKYKDLFEIQTSKYSKHFVNVHTLIDAANGITPIKQLNVLVLIMILKDWLRLKGIEIE